MPEQTSEVSCEEKEALFAGFRELHGRLIMDQKEETKLLKQTVKALAKTVLTYKLGKTFLPQWVFDSIARAKIEYGEDLTKII